MKNKPSQAKSLISCVDDVEAWHSPDREAFVTIIVDDHLEHHRTRSPAFERYLSGRYFKETRRTASKQMLADAIMSFEAKGIYDGPCYTPERRIAKTSDACWIDLGGPSRRAIKITAIGRSVVDNPIPRFIRSDFADELPEPLRGGNDIIELFREVVNADECAFRLLVGYCAYVLYAPASNYPIIAIGGEQGSGKSLLTKRLVSLLDPSHVGAVSPPKDERDLLVLAKSSHLIAFDNVSRLSFDLSDALCRMTSGAGFVTRKLHTDGDPYWFRGSRPIVLNGIPTLTERADLADRTISIRLQSIDSKSRQPEADVWDAWLKVRPFILGALCDAISVAIRRIDEVQVEHLPRMADFARFLVAIEPAFRWEKGSMLRAYNENRRQTNDAVFEADPVAVAIKSFFETLGEDGEWEGTTTDLKPELEKLVEEDVKRSRLWPKGVNSLGNCIDRAIPLLRDRGIDVKKTHTNKRRLVSIRRCKD